MNEYISSTNEAQEEFTRNFKLLRTESQRLATANEQLHKERFEGVKQLELVRLRVVKCEESLNLFKEKERTLTIQLDNLQEENGSLRKEIEELLQTLQTNEQFEVELTKENR
jgi:chromosome segregation ATPase